LNLILRRDCLSDEHGSEIYWSRCHVREAIVGLSQISIQHTFACGMSSATLAKPTMAARSRIPTFGGRRNPLGGGAGPSGPTLQTSEVSKSHLSLTLANGGAGRWLDVQETWETADCSDCAHTQLAQSQGPQNPTHLHPDCTQSPSCGSETRPPIVSTRLCTQAS
jgi:hypothetical protein